jgi:MarR family transcriptional regulator, organic hydroperoxide resistance regulator
MKDDEVSIGLTRRLRGAYWRMVRDVDSLRLRQWEHSKLTLPQLRVLFQIRRSPGITTGALAKALGVTMSTTSGLVAKLADRGLVARGSSADDRRQIPLELTDAGQALAGELAEVTTPFIEGLARELGDDLESVVAALDRLAAAAEKVREE